jgi:predicted SAM-dependent methyltransferase
VDKKGETLPIQLNIGCGDKQIPDERWKNVDARDLPGIHLVCDMNMVPDYFEENSVDLIYCCHALEHLRREVALRTLKGWAFILKPQVGILRVCVPDMGMIHHRLHHGCHLDRVRGLIWGGQNYPENTHYTGWDYQELARDLRACGFFNIEPYDCWEVMKPWVPPAFRDFSFMELDGYAMSLNVEAIAI